MGFLSRWFNLNKPRASGSGGIWDNINTPGSKGFKAPASSLPIVTPRGLGQNTPVLSLPNVQYNLGGVVVVDPYRFHAQADILYPRIPNVQPSSPVGYEWYTNTQGAVANPQVLPDSAPSPRGVAPGFVNIRENVFDGANPQVIRADQSYTASQRYFNERTPLPEFTTPSQLSHSVYTNVPQLQRGWVQAFVPEPGMQLNAIGFSPPYRLSTPISVRSNTGSVDGHRSAIKNAHAPKRKKSGG